MGKHIKEKTKLTLVIIAGIVLYSSVAIILQRNEITGNNTYSGVLSALAFGICLIMVLKDYKRGWISSMVLMSISLVMMIRSALVLHSKMVIPGMANQVFYMLTLTMLMLQFRKREMESVTDFLTGLRNRRGLVKLLKKKVEEDDDFYCIYIDLGNFKFVNDNFGHSYGDAAMRIVSARMNDIVKKGGTITRIGGDEFVIVLNGRLDAKDVTNRILDSICEKITAEVEGSKVDIYLNAFAGISEYPKDSMDYEALIKYADIAMYQATKNRNGRICFFDQDMAKNLSRQMQLEHLIKEGLTNNYFYLMYQPQYMIDGKKLRGFESLLRLKTPDGVMVSPGEFIPVAENSDLILKIDYLVLEMAMLQCKELLTINPKLIVSVNVSAKNIASLDFFDKLREIIQKTGYPTMNLEIEITEYCLVQSIEITIDNIKKLREIGIKVALDDFGTGYTSLSYLSKMPINLLKIDKTLIDNIENSEKNRDFVKAVIYMGHLMGCEVISEGVEELSQLDILREQDCDFVQGFIWGRPLEFGTARELVESNTRSNE